MNQGNSNFSKLDKLDVILLAFRDLVGKEFLADRKIISTAFYNLKGKYKKLIDQIGGFRERDFFPESERLDWALSHLNGSGIISMYMNAPPRYIFTEKPRVNKRYLAIDLILTEEEKIEIANFSKDFVREYIRLGGKIKNEPR